MSPSQYNKVTAYQWAVEVLEQARMKSALTVGVEKAVVRLQLELQMRSEKITENAQRREVRQERLHQAFQQMDDHDD